MKKTDDRVFICYRRRLTVGRKRYAFGDEVDTSQIRPRTLARLKGRRAILSQSIFNNYMADSPKQEEKTADITVEDTSEIVEDQTEATEETTEEEQTEEGAGIIQQETYTEEELISMKIADLRPIGDLYGVKDNKKSELIEKIINAQTTGSEED